MHMSLVAQKLTPAFVRFLLLSTLSALLFACSSLSGASEKKSGIDAQYQLSRIRLPSTSRSDQSSENTKSPGVTFYQKVLSKTLGSHCTLYPSDSEYSQMSRFHCGSGFTILRSMSRFYFEPDAASIGTPIIERDHRLLFKDLPNECAFF